MLISEHIEALQKLLEEKGDQELFMWVDSGQDTVFLAKVPLLKVRELDGIEYQIPSNFLNSEGKALAVVNLDSDSFDEDVDGIQDFNLED